jgi:hypothetical protein
MQSLESISDVTSLSSDSATPSPAYATPTSAVRRAFCSRRSYRTCGSCRAARASRCSCYCSRRASYTRKGRRQGSSRASQSASARYGAVVEDEGLWWTFYFPSCVSLRSLPLSTFIHNR